MTKTSYLQSLLNHNAVVDDVVVPDDGPREAHVVLDVEALGLAHGSVEGLDVFLGCDHGLLPPVAES